MATLRSCSTITNSTLGHGPGDKRSGTDFDLSSNVNGNKDDSAEGKCVCYSTLLPDCNCACT